MPQHEEFAKKVAGICTWERSMRKFFRSQLLAACALLGSIATAAPAEVFRIAPQQSAKIDKHGVCRIVKNINGTPAMVPAKSASEWVSGQNAFLAREREGLVVSECSCPPTGRTYGDVQYISNLYLPTIASSGDEFAGVHEVNGSAKLQFYKKSGNDFVPASSIKLATKPYGDVSAMAFSGDGSKLMALMKNGETRTYMKTAGTWSLVKSGKFVELSPGSARVGRIAVSGDGSTVAMIGPSSGKKVAISVLSARSNGDWVETKRFTNADLPRNGVLHVIHSDFELSEDGLKILIEFADREDSQGYKIGAALFEYAGGIWKRTKDFAPPSGGVEKWASYFLTRDGNRIIANMRGHVMGTGYFHVYEKRKGKWRRTYAEEYPKTSGLWDASGMQVWQVSRDGSILLEGLPGTIGPWDEESKRQFHYFDGKSVKTLKPGILDPGGKKWRQDLFDEFRAEAPRLSANGEVTIFRNATGAYEYVNGFRRILGPAVVLGMVNCSQ